ncbi:MAG: 50S ribosomal protein L5 [Candidatus Cloacimonadota bacterium]|nr:MAG: 50S ribosomal protein L5 [Candidatus Cloacimonadota bacterium]
MPRLKDYYIKEIIPELKKKLGLKNIMQVPCLTKIVLNMGVGESITNKATLDKARDELEQIAGQHPVITYAKKSISNFKLRQGMPIGTMVNLRGNIMYEFADRFFNIVLPRIRDFSGVPYNAFDGRGNYTIGIKEHIVFPEIDRDKIDKIRGLNVTFVTSAKTDEQGYELLKLMGMPFVKE